MTGIQGESSDSPSDEQIVKNSAMFNVSSLLTRVVTFLRRPYSRQQLLEAIERAVARDQVYQYRLAARHDAESRVETLTDREREVMQMIYDGLANKVIAMKLEFSARTVESIRAKIFDKMGVETPLT